MARHGMTRKGMAWKGKEWHGKEIHGKAWHGMERQGMEGKITSLDGKEIYDIKLSHMSLEKMFFISWDEKCSFFCDSCFIAIHILI
jgi:hypothetical protein